jgi:2-phospho-L-lactate guanylyltransferase
MAFVADADGVGTTAVVAADLDAFRPAFGPGSRQRHLDAGAREVEGIDVPSLRRDVDDRDSLAEAVRLGVGPRTSFVATTLGIGREAVS